jgi:hypothetical protein
MTLARLLLATTVVVAAATGPVVAQTPVQPSFWTALVLGYPEHLKPDCNGSAGILPTAGVAWAPGRLVAFEAALGVMRRWQLDSRTACRRDPFTPRREYETTRGEHSAVAEARVLLRPRGQGAWRPRVIAGGYTHIGNPVSGWLAGAGIERQYGSARAALDLERRASGTVYRDPADGYSQPAREWQTLWQLRLSLTGWPRL